MVNSIKYFNTKRHQENWGIRGYIFWKSQRFR